jgi:hypothetical protein
MKRSTIIRTGAVGAACALAGGAAGIAGSSASPSRTTKAPFAGRAIFAAPGLIFKGGPLAGAAGPPVHSDTVVPDEQGGFETVSMDRGSFSSLSGDQLTITEGTKTATYKTVTLTIPAGATIRRNEEQAKLSDLKAGDTVLVLQSPKGTVVAAHDAQHEDRLRMKTGMPGGQAGLPSTPPKLLTVPDEGTETSSSG